MGGSGDISSFSSSVVSDDPCKKEATSAWSCGSSPNSESAPSDPILLEGVSADRLAVGWLQKLSSCCLFLLLSSDPQLPLHLCSGPERAFFLYNLSISSSRVATVDKAFWCALCTLAKLLSIESSHSCRDGLFWGKWKPLGWLVFGCRECPSSLVDDKEDGQYLLQYGWFSWWRTRWPV